MTIIDQMVAAVLSLVQVHLGEAQNVLPNMAAQSVSCVVTSPPYWGLRDYGLDPTIWDSGNDCSHVWDTWTETHDEREDTNHAKSRTSDHFYGSESRKFNGNHQKHTAGQFCQICGAWNGCLGLEPTPELYVQHLVGIFQQVKRVLKDDGTLWLVLGDSFKNKQVQGIPWRVAFALQADDWSFRSEIIWHKPNPMPESVRDRPTKSHEYIFLLSKSSKYYYDYGAIKEPVTDSTKSRLAQPTLSTQAGSDRVPFKTNGNMEAVGNSETRNKRSVWTVTTKPYKKAHFATFPPDLIEPCILAGCPLDGTVLDPFAGSGTVGMVAMQHNRKAVLIEPSPEYIELINERIGL